MCSLFGLIDYDKKLTTKQKKRIVNTLARECEVRGTDATGIAYNFAGRMRIYKRPLPAHKMRLHVPNGVNVVMGHTRMTTQGSEKHNQNNHPFAGKADGKSFALAHNGVLWNDKDLKLLEQLPVTSVETDSYVAVQLIERNVDDGKPVPVFAVAFCFRNMKRLKNVLRVAGTGKKAAIMFAATVFPNRLGLVMQI